MCALDCIKCYALHMHLYVLSGVALCIALDSRCSRLYTLPFMDKSVCESNKVFGGRV